MCGNRAGSITILLDTEGRYGQGPGPDRCRQDSSSGQGGEASSPAEPPPPCLAHALAGEALPHWRVTSLSQLREVLGQEYELVGGAGVNGASHAASALS